MELELLKMQAGARVLAEAALGFVFVLAVIVVLVLFVGNRKR